MKVRVVELFSGVGAQRMALTRLMKKHPEIECEFVAQCDIDKFAIKSYNAIWGETPNLGDVSKLEKLPDCDIVTWSFPCFTGETLVRTKEGWKEIRNVVAGDVVETHDGWHNVLKSEMTGHKPTMIVTPVGGLKTECTENHRYYARVKSRKWDNDRRSYDRVFSEPSWVEAKDLTREHYVGYPVYTGEGKIPEYKGITQVYTDKRVYHRNELGMFMDDPKFWYTVGRYIADGWTKDGGIVISVGKGKETDIDKMCDLHKTLDDYEKSVTKVHISYREMEMFCKQFGEGAANKHIPEKYLNLPLPLAEALLTGYLDGDGNTYDGGINCCTISKQLTLDLARLIGRIYKRPVTITTSPAKTSYIEGRKVYCNELYTIRFHKDTRIQDKAFYENGWVWCPIRSVAYTETEKDVYDIEVEDAHSFIANGIVVHNCTDLSVAGRQEGMSEGSGTRSALCWEVVRLLRNSNRPKWLVMENVPAILFKTHKPEFDRLCKSLEDLGYHNRYGVLNAVDFDIAQNRKRCFMISCLGEDAPELPTGTGLKHAMKHYLEKEVDQKYFLSEERMKGIVLSTEKEKARGNGFKFEILDTEKVPAKTLNTREGHRKVCNYFMDKPRTLKRAGYVYPDRKSQHYAFYDPSEDGASVCVCL